MKKVELKDETWQEFSDGCRYHSDSNGTKYNSSIPNIKHRCWKPYSVQICHPMYCQRLKKKS